MHGPVLVRYMVRPAHVALLLASFPGRVDPHMGTRFVNGLASSPNSVFVTAYVAFEPSGLKGQVCG